MKHVFVNHVKLSDLTQSSVCKLGPMNYFAVLFGSLGAYMRASGQESVASCWEVRFGATAMVRTLNLYFWNRLAQLTASKNVLAA